MILLISQAAQRDIDQAIAFYEIQRTGLGLEFAAELDAAFKLIENFPSAWHPMSRNSRRCRLNRFPFGVIYQAKQDQIIVIAVSHARRKPRQYS
jgi:toxin ParE2